MTHLMDTVPFRHLGIVAGDGATLTDYAGKEYIDFFTDSGTASLGYDSKEMRAALAIILTNGIIHSPLLFETNVRERVAADLCRLTDMDKVFFCTSGAEAVEAAIKLARKRWWAKNHPTVKDPFYTGPRIFTQYDSFHGRTITTLAAGISAPYHREGFGPLTTGFEHFENWHEIEHGDLRDVCAVLVHPIRGNSDARPFQGRTWHDAMMELRDLRNFCTHHDITLIFDEVQTGSGRTGAYTYGQAIGVRPDILTLGKGIAMGVPMGAMLARGEYANVFTPGTHFSTFGGNPLCCQFLEQMLGWLQTPGNLDQVNDLGRLIVNEIRKMKHVSNARAQGMLIAADLDIDNKVLATRCQDKGLLIGCFRPVLKLTPPLNISMAELSKGLSILASCLEAM